MPMKLSDLRSITKPITITFDSGTLEIGYRPNSFTADAVDQINAAMADPDKQTDAVFQLIAANIATWDLEGDDGKIIPLHNVARLRAEVPMAIFNRIFSEIQDDQNPGKE